MRRTLTSTCLRIPSTSTPALRPTLGDRRSWSSASWSVSPDSSSVSSRLRDRAWGLTAKPPSLDRCRLFGREVEVGMLGFPMGMERGTRLWGLLGFRPGSDQLEGADLCARPGCRPISKGFNGINVISIYIIACMYLWSLAIRCMFHWIVVLFSSEPQKWCIDQLFLICFCNMVCHTPWQGLWFGSRFADYSGSSIKKSHGIVIKLIRFWHNWPHLYQKTPQYVYKKSSFSLYYYQTRSNSQQV